MPSNISPAIPGFPDIFWAAGDSAFLRQKTRGSRGRSNFMQGMADVRGNLNYHLLMHRRLFLTDSSILMTAPVLQLLANPAKGYQIFLEEGVIVPAMRPTADSFADVANQVISGGNYAELTPRSLRSYAIRLDKTNPHIVHNSPSVQDFANDLAREVLMQPRYWMDETEERFPAGLAAELVRHVMEAMHERDRRNFRQTEFWEFAELLHERGDQERAQAIRMEATIHSLGSMAASLQLPMSVPAVQAPRAGRVYGTGSPLGESRETMDRLEASVFTEELIDSPERTIYLLAQALKPDEIMAIRRSAGFERYVQSLEKAHLNRKFDPAALEKALSAYMQNFDLVTPAESVLRKHGKRARFLQKASKWTTGAQWVGPVPVGYFIEQLGAGHAATGLAKGATAAFFWMLNKGISRQLGQEETRAQVAQARLRQKHHVNIEFFGPVDRRYWWFYGDEPK